MKKSFFMLFVFFLCGIISADICINVIKDSNVLMNLEVYEGYANADLVYKNVFWNVLYERIKLFSFLFLLSFTPLKKYLGILLTSIFSFIWGFFIMSCIMVLGMAGVVTGIFSVLPHGLFYAVLIVLVIKHRDTYVYRQKREMVVSILNYVVMLLLLITGCVLESLIGTHFIPWVIRLSFI